MKWIKKIAACICIVCLCMLMNHSLATVSAASSNDIMPYAFRDSLPIQYEIWYSYSEGTEYRNYVYRDFTYVNGYNRTDTLQGNIELTPLEYEFYSKAQLWKVSYSYTKEKLIKRKNAIYLILAFFQINMGYHMVIKKIYEWNLFTNPWYLTALILYILTQTLLIVACVKTKDGA